MAMPQATMQWTANMVRALPDDGNRYEVLDGTLHVTPSPALRHQLIIGALYRRFDQYVADHHSGCVILSPADVELDEHTLVQPDLFVAPLVAGREPRDWNELGRLLLVIEVLSPSTARADRLTKRDRYRRAGIPEYWIVDGDARVIERWRPGDERPEVLGERIEWRADPAQEPLTIDLPTLFGKSDTRD